MKVVIFGVGKLAEYVEYVFTHDSEYHVAAFCVERDFMPENKMVKGLEIVDFNELEETYPPDEYKLFIAVGNNVIREKIYKAAKERNYSFVSYVSSRAVIWEDLELGENCFVGEGSYVQPLVSIGNNTILFGTRVGHHCRIGNHVILSVCCLAGNAEIGDNSFLGLNCTVNQNVKIGRDNIIGVACNIVRNTNDYDVYTNNGTVKRTMSSLRIQNKYLS